MDSLTQIILGAAVGEAVLGKKIGNRAMMWGAVGGTIPDLDVLGGLVLSEIDNLAFHRGISHSIAFSFIGALIFGWLVHSLYSSPHHKWIAVLFKTLAAVLVGSAINFVVQILNPGAMLPVVVAGLILLALLFYDSRKRYFSGRWVPPKATVTEWQLLFFVALFTHPILDSFTTYGTQLFAPFSDKRVAWCTISVVDPLYTVPFLICLLFASKLPAGAVNRSRFTGIGIIISSAYLLFTIHNKHQIKHVIEDALAEQQIESIRFKTNPTIFNNILWQSTIETEEYYYLGQYSFFDTSPINFTRLEKNHELLVNMDSDPTLQVLRWFCDDYFSISKTEDGVQFNDLRFGTFSGEGSSADDFIFRFPLIYREGQGYELLKADGGPPKGKQGEIFVKLWNRIWGV